MSRMMRSTEEERVYGETRSGATRGAEVAGSAHRRNGRWPRWPMAAWWSPSRRCLRTKARQVSLSSTVNKSGVPIRCTASCHRPQRLKLPKPALQLVPTRESAAHHLTSNHLQPFHQPRFVGQVARGLRMVASHRVDPRCDDTFSRLPAVAARRWQHIHFQ